MDIEILTIGRELLIGKIANTNAQWLAEHIAAVGHRLRRITVVDDDVSDISTAVREACDRAADLIILTGGLGPTFDDKTLEGVAAAFNKPLTVHPEALRMLREKYDEMIRVGLRPKLDMTPERVKMATIPEGAEPLRNPVGSAPGVMLRCGGAVLVVLPGVPAEMKELFRESVIRILEGKPSGFHYVEDSLKVSNVMESELAPVVADVMNQHPTVYIKSHPRGIEGSPKIELHFSCNASDEAEGQREIAASMSLMKQRLGEMGGSFE